MPAYEGDERIHMAVNRCLKKKHLSIDEVVCEREGRIFEGGT